MPTIRPTKRLLLPTDKRQRAIIEAIVNDQSTLWGLSNSDAIIRDILDSHLPKNQISRSYAEDVFAGDTSILFSIGSVLRQNVTGSVGDVKDPDYRAILEFGLRLMQKKGLSTMLDTQASLAHHFRSRFSDAVDYLNYLLESQDDAKRDYDKIRKVKYGRDLLVEADPSRFGTAPAQGYVQFALESFDQLGKRNDTCAYLADVFTILSEVESKLANDPTAYVRPDDASDRLGWAKMLDSMKNWS